MTRVEVLFPSDEVRFLDWHRLAAPASLTAVLRFSTDRTGADAAELAYAVGNSDDEVMLAPAAYRDVVRTWRASHLRSLSVGDVVLLDDVAWLCSNVGFTRLTDAILAAVPVDRSRVVDVA